VAENGTGYSAKARPRHPSRSAKGKEEHSVSFAKWFVAALVVASWFGISCVELAQHRETLESRASALDFPAGNVEGTVRWNGSPVSGLAANGVFAWVQNAGAFSGSSYVQADGRYAIPTLPPGSYAVNIDQNGCAQAEGQIGQTTATLSAGVTTTADVDITSTSGRVIGSITVNGTPLAGPRISIDALCGTWGSDQNGAFGHFLPPGSYTARVFGPSSAQVGSFSFTVKAGTTTDLGGIDFATGNVEGTVRWNGTPVSGLAANGVFAWVQNVGGEFLGSSYVQADGRYAIPTLPPGSYAVNVDQNGCAQAEGQLGQATATLSAGVTATADLDITSTAGRVIGSITVNGTPLASPRISIDALCGTWGSDQNGGFGHFLPPGSYTARVFGPSSAQVGSFTFAVEAGNTTDLGSIDFASGNVEGTVRWNGTPVSGLAANGVFAWVQSPGGGFLGSSYVQADGRYAIPTLPPGSYAVNIDQNGCAQAEGQIGQTTATLSAGVTTTADVDITSTAGRVIGSITVNGTPLAGPRISIDALCGTWGSDQNGGFGHFLPPGSYMARVFGPSSAQIGTFSFAILASQTTDVDIGTTPAGTNVSVDLSGGIGSVGGISLTFSQITASGTTTVVESGAGPPPPTGFRIVGISGQPRYWDIDTTAIHSGPITVCIHYDETQVHGQESNLRLRHDGGNGWEDVTTSLDTTANIICGVTTSVSPFAVVEPIVVDKDADGVADSVDQCPATQPGAIVNGKGCSIDDLVPCKGTWQNHGAYVNAFTATAQTFLKQRLIDSATKDRLVARAGSSKCGASR
jgi:hypothetical protein